MKGKSVRIRIPDGYRIKDVYSYEKEDINLKNGIFDHTFDDDMKAVGIYFER